MSDPMPPSWPGRVLLLGFMDGIAKPDTGNRTEMDRLVWIQPGTAGGPEVVTDS